MKIAIITRNNYRSPRFLAQSVSNMLNRIGIEHTIFFHGVEWLISSNVKNGGAKLAVQAAVAKQQMKQWKNFDLFIVCDNLDSLTPAVPLEFLRSTGKAILFHEVFYPGGSKYWLEKLPVDSLLRFDGYLTVSSLHDDLVLESKNIHPIGIDLSFCQPRSKPNTPFTALMDFARPGYEVEREIQLKILKELQINTIFLDKEYTFDEIEKVYNKANIYFVDFPEAFGVPITQLQFNGCYIASPHTNWVKRHALRPPHTTCDQLISDDFSKNFFFYSSENELRNKLINLITTYNPVIIKDNIFESQPEFCFGKPLYLYETIKKYINQN